MVLHLKKRLLERFFKGIIEVDSPVRETGPVHKSLSNTFRMHQKLNDSLKDSLSGHKGTKNVLSEKSKRPEGRVA